MNMSAIIKNGKSLFRKMKGGCEYTFNELKKLCGYEDTDLCFAVMYLIKEGQVVQYRTNDVYYQVKQ